MQTEGKLSENKILAVMAVLVVIILALNWLAYQSVSTEVTSQELLENPQASSHSAQSNPTIVD